jgi:pimeloyl-ACP methyl ester carboxylesterase
VTTTVDLPDGRKLALHEGGDPDGAAVVIHHGTPGSGLLYDRHLELATEQGIRLIGYDRAGYGKSSRAPGRRVVDVVADIEAVADALELERFATWGISGGGPHALACAARCGDRLAAVASLAAVAPYQADGLDWLDGMGEENHVEFGAALRGESELRAYLEHERETLESVTPEQLVSAFESLLGAADAAVLTGEFAAFMLAAFAHGLEGGVDGWLDDDLAFTVPWGFELGEIDRPVLLLHGADDRFVPIAHGEWLAARIPAAEARFDEADGHLTLVERRVREAHEWLLERLA